MTVNVEARQNADIVMLDATDIDRLTELAASLVTCEVIPWAATSIYGDHQVVERGKTYRLCTDNLVVATPDGSTDLMQRRFSFCAPDRKHEISTPVLAVLHESSEDGALHTYTLEPMPC